jgi:hypothetical protein
MLKKYQRTSQQLLDSARNVKVNSWFPFLNFETYQLSTGELAFWAGNAVSLYACSL